MRKLSGFQTCGHENFYVRLQGASDSANLSFRFLFGLARFCDEQAEARAPQRNRSVSAESGGAFTVKSLDAPNYSRLPACSLCLPGLSAGHAWSLRLGR